MNTKNVLKLLILPVFLAGTFFTAIAQNNVDEMPPPEKVEPAKRDKPPADAIVLFDRGSLDNFKSAKDGGPAPWKVKGGKFVVEPKTGNILTKEEFGDIQLHIEFKTPRDAKNFEGQKSGNSGIYIMGKYEVQVLNSYEKETKPSTQAGAVYRQYPPMVNASVKPGKWQEYDIIFEAPEYDENGNLEKPPYITVFHNGVVIQNHVEVQGPTTAYNKDLPEKTEKGPLMLQDHSNEVSYRNIWIRELK